MLSAMETMNVTEMSMANSGRIRFLNRKLVMTSQKNSPKLLGRWCTLMSPLHPARNQIAFTR